MSILDSIYKIFKSKDKDDGLNEPSSSSQSISNKDVATFKQSDHNNVSGNNFGTSSVTNNYYSKGTIYETTGQDTGDSKIAKKVKEIEKLHTEFKFKTAIREYESLLVDYFGEEINVNDKFIILNAILCCYVNLHDEENIEKYIKKIKDLLIPKELYKFHFMCAIYFLNKREFSKSLDEINIALELKNDYFKGLCLKCLIEFDLGRIDFDTALKKLVDEKEEPIVGEHNDKDNTYVYEIIGFISLSNRDFPSAIKFFTKAIAITPSKTTECQIAIAHFNNSILNSEVGKPISPKDVDFIELKMALSQFDEQYEYGEKEVNDYIKALIIPFYYRCILLTNNFAKFEKVFEDIKTFTRDEISEVYRIKALSELKNGTVNPATIDKLDPEDQEWLHFVRLTDIKHFNQVKNELSPVIWIKYGDDDKYIGMLLFACLYDNDYPEYRKVFKEYKELGKSSVMVSLTEGIYYERTGEVEKAERILKEITEENKDYLTYLELIYFYERNNKVNELYALYEDLTTENKNVIEQCKHEFLQGYLQFLLKNKYIEKALEVHKSLKPEDFDENSYKELGAKIAYSIEDYKTAAREFEELFSITKSLEILFDSMISYLQYNNLNKAEELLRLLSNNHYKNEVPLYCAYSNLELLKGNIETSYEYAKKAKDIDKDKPLSNAHPFYLQKSIRCNKDEGKVYIYEYSQNYPNYKHWFKEYKGLEKDEEGNEKLSQETIDIFNSLAEQFNQVLNLYKNAQMGISTVSKIYGQTLIQILDWRYYYGVKMHITNGNMQEVLKEEKNMETEILIDALGLYILAETGGLKYLNRLDKVYITYSTIGYLQQTLLQIEKPLVRDIFTFIDDSMNIEIVYPDYKLGSELNVKQGEVFEKNQIDSIVFAHMNNITYIYSDFSIKPCYEDYNEKFISLVSFIRALNIQRIISITEAADVIFNLKKLKYDFVNFTAYDIFNITSKNGFVIDDEVKVFFRLEKNYDFESFAKVFVEFIRMIYKKIERDKFDRFFDLYITLFDRYVSKTQYYIQVVEIKFGIDATHISDYINYAKPEKSIVDIGLSEQLLNSPELIRAYTIYNNCLRAVNLILHGFRNDPEDYAYYKERAKRLVINLPAEDVDKLIEQLIL